MRFIISLLLIIVLSLAAGVWLPFWSVALVAFAVSALIPQSPWMALLCGFLAVFLTWAGLAYVLDARYTRYADDLVFSGPPALATGGDWRRRHGDKVEFLHRAAQLLRRCYGILNRRQGDAFKPTGIRIAIACEPVVVNARDGAREILILDKRKTQERRCPEQDGRVDAFGIHVF